MSNQQITPAKTPYDALKSMIAADEVQQRFNAMLGERAQGFLATVLNTVYSEAALRDCEPHSVLVAAAKAAVLDLTVEPSLGQAWIVPRLHTVRTADGEQRVKRAGFQIGWKGYVQLAERTGLYERLNVIEYYEGEWVERNRVTGDLELKGDKISAKVLGYIAYFRLKTGLEKFDHMTVDEVREWAERYSPAYNNPKSAWRTNFDDMAKKTVLSRLLRKYGLLSIQLQQAWNLDEANRAVDDAERLRFPDFPLENDQTIAGAISDVPEAPAPTPAADEETAAPPKMLLETAANVRNAAGKRYGDCSVAQLQKMLHSVQISLQQAAPTDPAEKIEDLRFRRAALETVLASKK